MQHSWNWIAARLSPRRIWSKTATSTPRRPAIAAVEPLGDRVMFSVSVNASSEAGGPPVGDSAELAALIKGELPLVNEEQNLLKLAGPGVTPQTIDDFNKLGNGFVEVNKVFVEAAVDIFAKLGDIKGESLDNKHKDEIQVLVNEFAKIDADLQNLGVSGGVGNVLPAVQFENDAMGLLKLLQSGTGGDLDAKTEALYASIGDGFLKLDNTIIDWQSNEVASKADKPKDPKEIVIVKVTDTASTSIQQVQDPGLKDLLLGVEAQTAATLEALVSPQSDRGGPAGDVIN